MKLILLILGSISFYASTQTIELSEIMKGNEFIGHQPHNIEWSPDSKEIYFEWNKDNENFESFYAYNIKTKAYRKLEGKELQELPLFGFTKFEDSNGGLYKRGHNLWSWNAKGQRKIILSVNSDFQIHRACNPTLFILKEENNLIQYQLDPFKITQLTNFKKGKAPLVEGTASSFLKDQQMELFQIIQKNEERSTDKKGYKELLQPKFQEPIYTNDKYVGTNDLSPNLTYLIYSLDEYFDNEYTKIIDYVTEDGKAKTVNARSKVGSKDPEHELYLYNLESDSNLRIQVNHLTGIKTAPEYLQDYPNFQKDLEAPKNIIYHFHGFNEASTFGLVEIKSYDNKDRWICALNLETGELVELDYQHDKTWIGGPGISGWNMVPGNCGWLNATEIYFQSEESGFSHLYKFDLTDQKKTMLTKGNFEIHEAIYDQGKNRFFLSTNKTHAGNRDIHILNLNDNTISLISKNDGNHEFILSPNYENIAFRYSTKTKPWEIFMSEKSTAISYHQVTTSTTAEFNAIEWYSPEIITFKANDDVNVNARLYKPEADVKNGAAIMFVHGAGYLQNAHNWWSGYYREFMFHNLLLSKGYTVLDVDYRASKGYGRDFRTAIYQHMGGKDLDDYVDGKKWLVENEAIDPDKVGIYGGSYGGFITLMALLTKPGEFKCGAAIRSVTDWAHYNHAYTSNILNTPETDPNAFKKSSPIYFAEGLEDRLLMLHGLMDDNVQYQDVVRLSQRFIELGKVNWDLVGYPIEPHGFKETSSWVDEYGRILKMFEEELN